MSYNKCVYRNCGNISSHISMFRFPVNDPDRLAVWLRNSGNTIHLGSLTNKELSSKYICAKHFLPYHINADVNRLVRLAVPIHYSKVRQQTPGQHRERSDTNMEDGNTYYLESLTNKELRRRYICAEHFQPSDIYTNERSRLVRLAVPIHYSEVTQQIPDNRSPSPEVLEVKAPSKFYTKHKNIKQKTPEEISEAPSLTETPSHRNNKPE